MSAFCLWDVFPLPLFNLNLFNRSTVKCKSKLCHLISNNTFNWMIYFSYMTRLKDLNLSTFAVGAAVKCIVFFSFVLLSVCFRQFIFVKQKCVCVWLSLAACRW